MKISRYKLVLSIMLMAGWLNGLDAKQNVGQGRLPAPNPKGVKVADACPVTTAQIDLAINGVRARILDGGDLWWDPIAQTPYYEVPQGTNKNAIYSGALWIGGIDKTGQLLVAAQTYRQSGSNDFWGGPIAKDPVTGALGITSTRCNEFDRFWSVSRNEVNDFKNGGEATKVIKEWPGNGNVANGELPNLAPFFDADGNGIYDYTKGDYPYFLLEGDYPIDPVTNTTVCNDFLFGDRSIWWVFNDVGNIKTETNSNPIGLEIRAQGFAFKTSDQVNFMTFYKYQVINRSNDSLNQAYFGVWVDPDLGNASDDYVGCDVGLGLGYCYNGDPDDDGGSGYGLNPPAIGVDFFQGPLADSGDGIDNNLNGTVDEPGEQIIMSNFMYYENVNNAPNGNPATTDDYYQYLSSVWLDGQKVTYGEIGRNVNNPPTNYMFSNGTDPAFQTATPWNMVNGGVQPSDMRFLQSAGTFTLAPGAVNYITTGVVYGRATSGGPLASVQIMKLADQKAQALFDNCFKILDGPDAPDVSIRELDRKIILNLENTNNTKVELYSQIDPVIPTQVPADTGGFITITPAERSYRFQGYRIYQLANGSVTEADLNDISKAKLYLQVDIHDSVEQIVNFNYDNNLGAYVPQEVAQAGENKGLKHSFEITTDLFTQKPVINFTPYYFLVVSYAYNNFRKFDPNNASFTQARPFVQGRNNVKVYSAIPHKSVVENGGTQFNVEYGQGVEIKRIEGSGNGGNVLELTSQTINEILTSPDNRAVNPIYQAGKGPISVRVYDPMRVKAGNFRLAFSGISDNDYWYLYNNPPVTYAIQDITYSNLSATQDTVWITTQTSNSLKAGDFITLNGIQGGLIVPPNVNESFQVAATINSTMFYILTPKTVSGSYTQGTGSVIMALSRSSLPISSINEQLYEPNKIEISASKINGQEPGNKGAPDNGFLESSLTFADPSRPWLTGVTDVDAATTTSSRNWILSGTQPNVDQLFTAGGYMDSNSVYETVIGGTWAPFILVNGKSVGAPKPPDATTQQFLRFSNLHSVDIVFTKDKNLWTRSVVMEEGETFTPSLNIGNAKKFDKRNQPSVDKDGRAYGDPNANAADAGLTDTVGMGWFPGYAINIETGERLNIIFGENSSLTTSNSQNMVWDPTSNIGNDDGTGRLSFGGMHYIYILNHDTVPNLMAQYDNGAEADLLIKSSSASVRRSLYRSISWVGLPLVDSKYSLLDNDAKIRIRVRKNYRNYVSINTAPIDSGKPRYEFVIPGSFEPTKNITSKGSEALNMIQVVPNPYYAYSRYEQTTTDQLDNRVRIINIPSKCTVSIYSLNGTLVRQIKHDVASDVSDGQVIVKGRDDNLATSLDWDIKNTAGVKVASGIYIIHIDAGPLGEKIVKWFGIMRPIDLDSF